MRTIPEPLLEALRRPEITPAFRVHIWPKRFGVWTPRWESLYESPLPAHPHRAAITANGSIIWAGLTDGGMVQVARVAEPSDPNAWGNWFVLGGGDAVRPAVIAHPQAPEVYVIWVGSARRNVRWSYSLDDGQSWSTPAQIIAEPSGTFITGVCGAFRRTEPYELCLFYTHDAGGAGADDTLKVMRYAEGVWRTPLKWPHGVRQSFAGLDVVWLGDYWLMTAGREANPAGAPRLWSLAYGDGMELASGTWSTPAVVETSDDTRNAFALPALCDADVLRLSYVASWSGEGASSRVLLSTHLPAASLGTPRWREGEPFESTPAELGVSLCWDSAEGVLYLIGPQEVWRAPYPASPADLSAHLVAYRYRETPKESTLEAVFDDAEGALLHAGILDGTHPLIHPGAALCLGRGAQIGGEPYYVDLPAMYIESVEWEITAGVRRLILRGLGWRDILRTWRADRAFSWQGETAASVIAQILARVGLDFALSVGLEWMDGLRPAFILPPGQTGATALSRLAENLPLLLRFDGVNTLLASGIPAEGPADYSLGAEGEGPYLSFRPAAAAVPCNLIELYGAGEAYGRAEDAASIAAIGARRRILREPACTSSEDAAAWAAGMLAKERLAKQAGVLRLRPLFGVEPWDRLALTDAHGRAHMLCVTGIEERFDARRRGEYEQRLSVVSL